jgi:uncharacterized protein
MLRLVTPHIRVECVCELTPEHLRELGLRTLLLDVDCTLTRYHQHELSPEVAAWIEELRAADVGLCLVSNGMGRRIRSLAKKLGLPCVAKAMKPLPWGVWSAMRKLNSLPAETAIVGDQIFADVMAGRLAGVRSILVRPIHPEEEPWFTRLKRRPEQFVLRRL